MKDQGYKKGVRGGFGGKPRNVGGHGLGFGPPAVHPVTHNNESRTLSSGPQGPAFRDHPTDRATHLASSNASVNLSATWRPSQTMGVAQAFDAAPRDTRNLGSAAPRGFVASSKFVGGSGQNQATIVMPIQAEVTAARNERPSEWMQKRLQQGGRPGLSGPRWGAPPVSSQPVTSFAINDAVARAVEAAKQAAARAREETERVHAESSARIGGGNASGTSSSFEAPSFPGPPPRGGDGESHRAVPPPSFGYGGAGGYQQMAPGPAAGPRKPALSAEEARALAQAAAARILGGAAKPASVPAVAVRTPLSAEQARAIAQAAAANIVAKSGSSTASGQTEDGKVWAWGSS